MVVYTRTVAVVAHVPGYVSSVLVSYLHRLPRSDLTWFSWIGSFTLWYSLHICSCTPAPLHSVLVAVWFAWIITFCGMRLMFCCAYLFSHRYGSVTFRCRSADRFYVPHSLRSSLPYVFTLLPFSHHTTAPRFITRLLRRAYESTCILGWFCHLAFSGSVGWTCRYAPRIGLILRMSALIAHLSVSHTGFLDHGCFYSRSSLGSAHSSTSFLSSVFFFFFSPI